MSAPPVHLVVEGEEELVSYFPHYYSTYCIHGHHDECRKVCKTCEAPCRCACHEAKP